MTIFNSRKGAVSSSKAIAHAASWYCAIVLAALILLTILTHSSLIPNNHEYHNIIESNHFLSSKPCDEISVVGEGETLNTISGKCNDPFIVENNPHIHDPGDVFPGLVIKITRNSHHM